jgi:two-component system, cell cycle sensor histidine kinase and response regulator CckA
MPAQPPARPLRSFIVPRAEPEMNVQRSHLRGRLALVVFVAVLPVIGAIVYTQVAERRSARIRTMADNLRLARLAASQQATVLDGTRRLLLTLAQLPAIGADDPRACLDVLPKILRDHPGYFNLTVANADGSFFCTANPIDPRRLTNARGRSWFERARQTRTTAVGDYQISATTGQPAIVVAHPLLDASGTVTRIVTATIGLDQLHQIASHADLPASATLTLVDRTRTILAHVPDGDAWVGKKVPEQQAEAIDRLASGGSEAFGDSPGVDGVNRLYVSVPVPSPLGAGLYVGMGIERDTAFVDADRVFRQELWLLGIVMLAAIGSAVTAGQMFVLAPIRALRIVTDRIAAGDLNARAELASAIGGVSELGDAVNAMAVAIDERQRDRNRAEAELRQSEDRYRVLFAANPHPMWVYDLATLEFLEVNNAAVKHYGYSRAEFLAMRIIDIRPAADVHRLRAELSSAREPLARSGGWRHRLKSGDLIDVEITSHSLTFGGRPAALVTAADVTDRQRAETALAERTAMSALTADVGVALNRPSDLHVCLQHCADAIVARLDGATAGIWKLDASGETLELVASAGGASGLHANDGRVPIGQFTIGRIAQDRRARFTNDVSVHPELRDEDWARQPGISAFAGCPLLVDSRVVGVMAVFASHPLSNTVTNAVASVADLMALGITRDQSEGARRLLAAIVESSEDAIFGTAPDGTVLSWNSGAQKLFGYTTEEIVGQSVARLCPADRAGELADLLLTLRQGVYVAHRETVRQRKDGSQVPVSISLSPIRDSADRIAGISAMMRDITERQRAERTLRESEDRFRLIAETVTQVFWIADVELRTMIYVSPAYERIWGRSCESLRTDSRSFLEAIHAEDRALVIDVLAAQQAGEPFEHEYRIVRPDGEVRWIRDRGFPVRAEGGRVVQYVGVAEDITERRRAEDRIRLLARALESTNDMVCVADVSDRITFANAAFLRVYGYAADEVLGQTAALVRSAGTPDAVVDEIARASRTDGWSGELMNRRKDGTEFRVGLRTSAIRDERGSVVGLLGVARDVSEQRSLEDQLRQAQKMEAIGQLAGGIAHDFNNLLTAIQGFAGLVAESLPEDDERRADINEIQNAATRAAGLTRQLLAFSRKQILATSVLHLGDVVGEITPMLRRLLGETIDLTTTVGDRGLVKADPGQLQQVLMNLVVNARDAMAGGGQLTIATADVVLDDAFARHHPSVCPGPHVVLAVCDTGHGMDDATQKRIFEPFFTTKPKGQGTGLGLATVYGIVKQSGGSIWVESDVGRGTTFKVYLPRTNELEAEVASAPADALALRGQETILLVEDEELVRNYVYRILSRRGYQVHAIAHPRRAIEYAGAHRGAIDLVFSDVVLPDMSGKAMVEELQRWHPESKVLYMSGYADDAIVHHGVLDKGMSFLHKPFSADALAAKVRDVLDTCSAEG